MTRSGYYCTSRDDHDMVTERAGAFGAGLLAELHRRARHAPGVIPTRHGDVDLVRGEALIAVSSLADRLKVPRRNVQRALDWFEASGIITTKPATPRSRRAVGDTVTAQQGAQSTAPFPTIVTLCNYDVYSSAPENGAQSDAQSDAQQARSSWHESAPKEEEKKESIGIIVEEESKAGAEAPAPAPVLRLVSSIDGTKRPRKAKEPVDQGGDAYRIATLMLELLRAYDEHAAANLDAWARELAPSIEQRGAAQVEAALRFAMSTPREAKYNRTPKKFVQNLSGHVIEMSATTATTKAGGDRTTRKGDPRHAAISEHFGS